MHKIDIEKASSLKIPIEKAENIAIFGHKNPDGDCIGATIAVKEFLSEKNINAKVIIPNSIPQIFNWIPEINDVIIYKKTPETAINFIKKADVIFMLDFNSLIRIPEMSSTVETSNALKINIDHHQDPKKIAKYQFVDPLASSASELVFHFLKIIDKNNINKKIAELLFMGIVSDTNSFMFNSANTETLLVGAELLKYNIDKQKIINGLYNNYEINRPKFIGYLLNKKLIHYPKQKLAYVAISQDEKNKFNYKPGDLENFVNIPLEVKDVKISILIREVENNNIRISLRSKENIDVNKIAQKLFNGGGHINAAGGKLKMNLHNAEEYIKNNLNEIMKYL